jgi:hypothetical protein
MMTNLATLSRFVITRSPWRPRDLLFAAASQKQIPRAKNPGARNDNSQWPLILVGKA